MRINARFLGASGKQVDYLVAITGRSRRGVLLEAVGHDYLEVRGGDSAGLRHFDRHVGAYRSGTVDTSARYKDSLAEDSLAKRWRR